MGCIVVGRQRADVSDSVLRFAITEARLRGLPVRLTHVWDLPVEVAIEVDAGQDREVSVTAAAVPGSTASALLAQEPELLVLGRHTASKSHLSRVVRSVLHHVSCPVVVVPSEEDVDVERVVVGVGDTAASVAAARWGADEAGRRGAELILVHAWQLEPHGWRELARPVSAVGVHQGQVEDRLRRWVHDVLPGVEATTYATHGAPLDAVLAASTGGDLLVVGYSPHERLSRVLHGHIADDLVVYSGRPVAVIPASTPSSEQHRPVGTHV